MSGIFDKRYHPPGTPPGTLTLLAGTTPASLHLHLVDYTDSEFTELELAKAIDCKPYLDRNTVTWIHVQGQADPDTLRELGALFGLHPLALEDTINQGQRPKVEEYDGQLFAITSLPVMRHEQVTLQQVSIFLGPQYVISFYPGELDPFEPVRNRLRKSIGRLRQRGADRLLYALLDLAIDAGFPILESISLRVDELEEELLNDPEQGTLMKLHHLRRELLVMRRTLWPQRDMLNLLIREDMVLITEQTRIYLRDCHDHTVQIMDLLETYREMSASMLDVYLSNTSNKLNEIMRVLTMIATIFIPLTFIAGLYGMNFGSKSDSPWNMPELNWYFGYPMALMVMLAVAVGMIIYFKRKKWF